MTNTDTTKHDMDHRPETYWGIPQEVVAKVRGERKRQAVQEAISQGGLDRIRELIHDDPHLDELLPACTQLDPWMEVGECLPQCLPGEVEIARVIEEGVPSTVFSIRARRDGDVIRYRVINDTDDVVAWGHQETSSEPLTLVELITLIHSVQLAPKHEGGLIHGLWHMHHAHPPTTPERAAERVSVSSPYYDQLELWYEQHRQDWVEEMEEREDAMARREAAAGESSQHEYVVDEGMVAALLQAYPKLTREKAIEAIELAGG